MKNISTGAGLAILGLGIALHPLLSGLASSATASASTAPAAAALASAASAQAGPTVVWYGTAVHGNVLAFFRCWSDGRVEYMLSERQGCSYGDYCGTGLIWQTLSSGTQGYRAAADINADERVDGADLASVLGNWGDAPRVPFPPSNCPLDLINP
jgi:hypothetical protein